MNGTLATFKADSESENGSKPKFVFLKKSKAEIDGQDSLINK